MRVNEATGRAIRQFLDAGLPFQCVETFKRTAGIRKAGSGNADLIARLLPKVAAATGRDDWRKLRRTMERRDCTIVFLAPARHRHQAMALKIFKPGMVGGNLAMNLHHRSVKLHRAATEECTVPEPVLRFPEENAWAMRYVDAPTAGSLLMRKCFSADTRRRVVRQAAVWLRWFHGRFGETPKRFDSAPYLEGLRKSREKLHAAGRRDQNRFLSDCMTEAAHLAAGLDGRLMSFSTAHGDFTPFNLFIDGPRVVGFDFRANQRMPIHHDITRFLVYLDVYGVKRAAEDELSRWGCRGSDFEVFFESYDADHSIVQDGTWRRLYFLEVVRRLVSVSPSGRSVCSRALRSLETAALSRCARALLKGMTMVSWILSGLDPLGT